MKTNRLYFIDALRSFAILMMLQGHFMSILLQEHYFCEDYLLYNYWEFFRGNTAPLFFCVSGFVVFYLMQKTSAEPEKLKLRIQKSLRRGGWLIFWGYLLRLNISMLLWGEINNGFWLSDVLHIIGLSMILSTLCYCAVRKLPGRFQHHFFLLAGILLFLLEPIYKNFSYEALPNVISNYLVFDQGSTFTLLPWLGFFFIGAFAGTNFGRFTASKQKFYAISLSYMSIGLGLAFYSSAVFYFLGNFLNLQLFTDIAFNNYLFIRLGYSLIFFSVFTALEAFWKPGLFLNIGTKTLNIYIVHFILLYGTWFNLGLVRFYKHELSLSSAIILLLLFVLVCLAISLNLNRILEFIKAPFYNISFGRIKSIKQWVPQFLKIRS